MEKILILSDTHRDINLINKVLKKENDYSTIIHIGDHHTDLEEVKIPSGVKVLKVRGNCDFQPEESEIFTYTAGVKMFITHGHDYDVKYYLSTLEYRAEEIGADLVLFGHTHIKKNYTDDSGIRFFNPGSLSRYRSYGRPSYGFMEIDNGEILVLEHREI